MCNSGDENFGIAVIGFGTQVDDLAGGVQLIDRNGVSLVAFVSTLVDGGVCGEIIVDRRSGGIGCDTVDGKHPWVVTWVGWDDGSSLVYGAVGDAYSIERSDGIALDQISRAPNGKRKAFALLADAPVELVVRDIDGSEVGRFTVGDE